MLEHPERPTGARRIAWRGREWFVFFTIALAAGAVTAFGVPWWLSVPVALVLELGCGLVLLRARRRPRS